MRKLPFLFKGALVEIEADSAIQREDLYGKSKKLITKDGQELQKGILTPDGKLFAPSEFKLVKTDHEGSLAETPKIITADGAEAPIYKSSAKEARPLEPIGEAFPDLAVEQVIPVRTPSNLPEGNYKTGYTYNDSATLQDAVLVVKAGGEGFLLAGENKETAFLKKGETYSFFDEDDATAEGAEGEEEGDFNIF